MKVNFAVGLIVVLSLFVFSLAYDEDRDLMERISEMERAIEQRLLCAPQGGICVLGIGCCAGLKCSSAGLGLIGSCQ